jgi:hypothetical protein
VWTKYYNVDGARGDKVYVGRKELWRFFM